LQSKKVTLLISDQQNEQLFLSWVSYYFHSRAVCCCHVGVCEQSPNPA